MLFIIGINDVQIPIIPSISPAVANPLFFFSSTNIPSFILL
nr:MAG TPA: cell division cylcle protein 20 [Caudoviricetes sp.]